MQRFQPHLRMHAVGVAYAPSARTAMRLSTSTADSSKEGKSKSEPATPAGRKSSFAGAQYGQQVAASETSAKQQLYMMGAGRYQVRCKAIAPTVALNAVSALMHDLLLLSHGMGALSPLLTRSAEVCSPLFVLWQCRLIVCMWTTFLWRACA
eukprot:6197163-Pleurochrysis_carterae.AAC.3